MSERSLITHTQMNRATPLPAAERRAAIIAVTEQLLVAKGAGVSTREIAEAAGIAEGTIFRVFPTKDAIIDAIFADAFDPEKGRAELAEIDASIPLDACLIQIVTAVQQRIRRILALIGAVGFRQPLGADKEHLEEQRRLGYDAIAAVLRPYSDELRIGPEEAARHIHGLALAMTHPMLTDRPVSDPAAIVDIALNGMARPPSELETKGS